MVILSILDNILAIFTTNAINQYRKSVYALHAIFQESSSVHQKALHYIWQAPEKELFAAIETVIAGQTYVQQTLVSPLFTYRTIFDGLTRQEQVVFKKLIERKSRAQIAKEMNIVERSLENYLSRIYMKTGCKNHEELIKKFGE